MALELTRVQASLKSDFEVIDWEWAGRYSNGAQRAAFPPSFSNLPSDSTLDL